MDHLPETIAAFASLVLALATLVQVVKARADVSVNTAKTVAAANDAKTAADATAETLGVVNGHGTAMEALGETMARQDKLLELSEYTHNSVHQLRNAITPLAPLAPMVMKLWKDAGNPEPPPAADTAKGT